MDEGRRGAFKRRPGAAWRVSRVVKHTIVEAPAERVFRALVVPEERRSWVRTLIEEPHEGPLRLGDKVHAARRGSTSGSRYTLTVVALDPPRRLAMDVARNGQHVGRNTFEIEPVEGGTLVRGTAEVQLSGLQRMMTGMVVAAAEREMESELLALRRHLGEGDRG